MEVASLTTKVEVDVSKLGPSLDSLQKNVEALGKNMTGLTANVSNLTNSMDRAGTGVTKLKKPVDDLGGSSGNLGRYMRELTTSMLGVSPVTIALGTVMGNLATQMLSRLVLAIVSSVTQFATLQNSLAEVSSVSNQVAASFEVITTAALTSQKSLSDLTKSYASLQEQATGTRVTVQEVNKIFTEYQAHLGVLQQPTILSSASQALSAFGDAFARLDQLLGASSGIVFVLGKIRDAIASMASYMPKTVDATTGMKNELAAAEQEAVKLSGILKKLPEGGIQWNYINTKVIENYKTIADLTQKIGIAEGKVLSPERQVQRDNTLKNITADLDQQFRMGNLLSYQQETLNKQYQIENQIRTTGKEITNDEAIAFRMKLQLAQAANQIQPIRESLRTAEQAERESYATRIMYLTEFYGAKQNLIEVYNARVQEEENRHWSQMRLIQLNNNQMILTAQTQFGNSLANVFGIIGQKSKVAQIAGIAVSTAVNAALAWQNTLVAATRAQMELGPILGPPMAAEITAWGAANVAAIIAAGALNIGGAVSAPSGGSSSSSGSGGATTPNTTTSTSTNAPTPSQAITIEGVDPAMVYTGTQLNALIERMNDAVKNGATMITTKTRTP